MSVLSLPYLAIHTTNSSIEAVTNLHPTLPCQNLRTEQHNALQQLANIFKSTTEQQHNHGSPKVIT